MYGIIWLTLEQFNLIRLEFIMEDKDLFSYANSNDVVDEGEASFDLNAFSSKNIEEEAEKPRKRASKKQKII